MKYIHIAMCMLLCSALFAQENLLSTFEKPSIELDRYFSDYQTHKIKLPELKEYLTKNVGSTVLFSSDDFEVELELAPVDLLASDFQIKTIGKDGKKYIDYNQVNTYIAYDTQKPEKKYRFYISETRFQGMFEYKGNLFRVESANKYSKQFKVDDLVIYRPADRKEIPGEENYSCQLVEEEIQSESLEGTVSNRSVTGCSEVELAIAADYLFFLEQGGIDGVLDELVSIMNDVQGDYSVQFNDVVEFKITELLVSMCEECDPWITSTNMYTLLDWFKDWGLNDGFEKPHDLGLFWTDRITDGGVVGVAYLNSLCGTNRYSAMRHFTNDPGKLRMMTSHEIGHTFGCPHNYSPGNSDCHPDPGRPPLIMDPVVNSAAVSWSTGVEVCVNTDPGENSVERINEKLNQADCFALCTEYDCDAVSSLQVHDVLADYAEISWVGTSDNYTIKLREGDYPYDNILFEAITEENQFYFDDTYLFPEETYVVSVIANCGSGESSVREVVFITSVDVSSCHYSSYVGGEAGWEIWNDGGDDATLANNAVFANTGTFSFLIKDNTETSVITSNDIDLSSEQSINLSFNYISSGFNNSTEDFWLQVSLDGGATFETLKTWGYSLEFENDIREFEDLIIPGPFSTTTKFRFRCDASGNNDRLYIDDIEILACDAYPCDTVSEVDAESGWEDWNDGGNDAHLINSTTYAYSGTHSFRIRDNSVSACITTNDFDLSDDASVSLSFTYISLGFENAYEDFWLQISLDGGATFQNLVEWKYIEDFENLQREFEDLIIEGPFSETTQFRFRCDATSDVNMIFIDDIVIDACEAELIDSEDDSPCPIYTDTDAESGWEIWNDGGADATLTNNPIYAQSGTFSYLIKDNTNTSVITTNTLDLQDSPDLLLLFNFITDGFNSADQDFWFQVSTDGGASYTTVAEWDYQVDFENGVREWENLLIEGPFTGQTKFRFRCDATGNNDKVYIDDIFIAECINDDSYPIIGNASNRNRSSSNKIDSKIYPNPFISVFELNLKDFKGSVNVRIFNNLGKTVYSKKQLIKGIHKFDSRNWEAGIYFVQIDSQDMVGNCRNVETKKIIKIE